MSPACLSARMRRTDVAMRMMDVMKISMTSFGMSGIFILSILSDGEYGCWDCHEYTALRDDRLTYLWSCHFLLFLLESCSDSNV